MVLKELFVLIMTIILSIQCTHSPNNNIVAKRGKVTRQFLHQIPDDGNYVAVVVKGRIGNQMFYYASLIGVATRVHKLPLFLIHSSNPSRLLRAFHKTRKYHYHMTHNQSLPSSFVHYKKATPSRIYDGGINDTLPGNILLNGHYSSYRYWWPQVAERIRHDFEFKPTHKQGAEQFLEDAKRKYLDLHSGKTRSSATDSIERAENRRSMSITYVGVHVRRGDYLSIHARAKGKQVATAKYIHDAMSYYAQKHKHVIFIICSDGLKWCKQNIKRDIFQVEFCNDLHGPRGAVENLAVLAHCNHSIITDGTFGFWSAFLANGEVVYQKNIAKPHSIYWFQNQEEDFRLPHWTGM